jgi:hypothetical protein
LAPIPELDAMIARSKELGAWLDGIMNGGGDQSYSVTRGETVEAIARATYGDDWRAGVAAIIGANDLSFNDNGSPLIYAGSDIILPSLNGLDTGALASLGGDVIAHNTQTRLANDPWAAFNEALAHPADLGSMTFDQLYAATSATLPPLQSRQELWERHQYYLSLEGRASGAGCPCDLQVHLQSGGARHGDQHIDAEEIDLPSHQIRNAGLGDAHEFGRGSLAQLPFLDVVDDGAHQLRPELHVLRFCGALDRVPNAVKPLLAHLRSSSKCL